MEDNNKNPIYKTKYGCFQDVMVPCEISKDYIVPKKRVGSIVGQNVIRKDIPMQKVRAWRSDGCGWGYGFYYEEAAPLVCMGEPEPDKGWLIFVDTNSLSDWGMPRQMVRQQVRPETVCRPLGKTDINQEELFENDIIEGLNGTTMVIRYGEYKAYCPNDKCYMESVGFYAEAVGMDAMPIGPTEEYAIKMGTLLENPELLEGD